MGRNGDSSSRTPELAPVALPLRTEAQIVESWSATAPVVSVLCSTYQHVNFIADAIRGFLGQVTEFPFEVLIRDDGSVDGSADIVRDYSERYPLIIRSVLEPKNTYSSRSPGETLRPLAVGEYVAACEGDDYWVDATKLQRQVDALREDDRAFTSFHSCFVTIDGVVAGITGKSARRIPERGAYLAVSRIPTLSMLYRNQPRYPIQQRPRLPHGDVFLKSWLIKQGAAIRLPGPPAGVYRRHAGSVTSRAGADPMQTILDTVESEVRAAKYFADSGDRDIAEELLALSAITIIEAHDLTDVNPRRRVSARVNPAARAIHRARGQLRSSAWANRIYRSAASRKF